MITKLTTATHRHGASVFALAAMLLCCPALRAEIHSDFDPGGTYFGGDEGWFNYDGHPDFGTSTPAGGTSTWLRVKPQQYWGKITSQSWAVPDITVADWNSNSYLQFDVIVDGLWFPNNPTQAINIEFQTTGGTGGDVNQSADPTIDTSLKDIKQTVSVPLASLQPFDPTATGWNLSFNLFPGYAWEWDAANPQVLPYDPRYYIDNVRWVVPEPSTLSLLALATIGAIGIRRRQR